MGKNNKYVPQRRGTSGFDKVSNTLRREFEWKLLQAGADYEARLGFTIDFLTQACGDAMIMAMNDIYDLGPSRVEEARDKYKEYFLAMMDALIDDSYDETTGNGDKELTYFWASVDERLKQIEGPHFEPHEVRYDESGIRTFTELFRRFMARTVAEAKEGEADGA